MKKILPYIIFLMPVLAFAQEDIVYSRDNKVHGYVRKLKVRRDMLYMAADTITYGENKGIHTYTFNDNLIVSDTSITDFNHDTTCYKYEYDNDGHLVRIFSGDQAVLYKYSGDKLVLVTDKAGYARQVYKHNGDSTKISVCYRSPEIVGYNSVCFYDEKGNVVTIKYYLAGKLNLLYALAYDSFGNVLRKIVFDKTGKIVYDFTYEYTYDTHNNFTERMEYRFEQPYSITKREITYQ